MVQTTNHQERIESWVDSLLDPSNPFSSTGQILDLVDWSRFQESATDAFDIQFPMLGPDMNVALKILWNWKCPQPILSISTRVFEHRKGQDGTAVAVGTSSGHLHILKEVETDQLQSPIDTTLPLEGPPFEVTSMDAKCGAITSVRIEKLVPHSPYDVVAGDSKGNVVITLNDTQVLHRIAAGAPVSVVTTHSLPGHVPEIVVGTTDGRIVAFDVFGNQTWKENLRPSTQIPEHLFPQSSARLIRCMLPIHWKADSRRHDAIDSHGVAVCDEAPFLHILHAGVCFYSKRVPSRIYSMCQGSFVSRDCLSQETASNDELQLIFSGDDGFLYLLHDDNIYKYAEVNYTVTKILCFPTHRPNEDLVLVAGHFPRVLIYRNGQMLTSLETSDWVYDMQVVGSFLYVTCLDRTVKKIQISVSFA